MTYNKIYAVIGEERHIVLDPINYQYDIKQILVIQGETVPDYYEADVCNVGDTATLTMIGTAADGVEIPDTFLQDGRNVLVYVVIPGSGGDVQTRYDITIPVDERGEREDIDPSEAEQQQIDSLVAALNSGVGRAETAAGEAEAASQAVQDMGVEAETLAAGSTASVEKTVNPETGAVTLSFGIPRGDTGDPGYSPTIQIATITGGHRITVTDRQGSASFDVMDGEQGNPGTPGDDGYSPAVTITTITGGHRVTITDKTHQSGQTFDVMDGEQGNPGTPGDDGYSPAVTITTITGGHRVTITDKTHPSGQSFDVMDGVIQSVNGKSAASITLDAGDIGYDDSETYQSGTAGAALNDLSRQLSDKQDKTNYVTLTGTIITQTGVDNTMYLCGELAELTFTVPATGQTAIRFTSGTTPTVVTFSGVTAWLNGFSPLVLEANKLYEINILNGVGVAAWT